MKYLWWQPSSLLCKAKLFSYITTRNRSTTNTLRGGLYKKIRIFQVISFFWCSVLIEVGTFFIPEQMWCCVIDIMVPMFPSVSYFRVIFQDCGNAHAMLLSSLEQLVQIQMVALLSICCSVSPSLCLHPSHHTNSLCFHLDSSMFCLASLQTSIIWHVAHFALDVRNAS